MLSSLPFEPLQEALHRSQQHLPLGPSSTLWFKESPDASRELIRPRAWDLLDTNLRSLSSPASALWLSVLRGVFDCRRHLGLVDGFGRCLLLLTKLLDSLLVPLKNFTNHKAVFGLGDPHHSVLAQQRVLRLLMQHRGILLYDKAPSEENGSVVGVDWLDRITHDTILELAQRGDFFFLGSCTSDVEGVSPHTQQDPTSPSLYALVAGSAYHLLATEVEGEVRDTLHQVLMEFLFSDETIDGPVQASTPTHLPLSSSSMERGPTVERLRLRLATLDSTWDGVVCFANALSSRTPFSSTAREVGPTFEAAVSGSRVLPRSVFLLPVVGGSPTVSWAKAFFTLPARSCGSWFGQFRPSSIARDDPPVGVLLLRLDPAGEWLPQVEDLYNTQTFLSYYCNEAQGIHADDASHLSPREAEGRGGGRGKGLDRDEIDDEESFYEMQARQIGITRCVQSDPEGYRGGEWNSESELGTDRRYDIGESTEEKIFEGLVDRACRQLLSSYRGKEDEACGTQHIEFCAALRLFIWCFLHDVRVVLTPECVPPLFKRFSELYGDALWRHLNHTEVIWLGKEERSLAEKAEDESMVRIIDGLHLECFERLLIAVPCLHEPSKHPERFVARSAAVLSRNRLRLPSVVEDALLKVSECTLTSVEEVLRYKSVQKWPMMDIINSVTDPSTTKQLVCGLRLVEPPILGERRWVPSSLVGSILIAAPTRGLEQRWIRLLRKCITTLRGIFHNPSHHSHCLSWKGVKNSGSETGVVRAGGAFFFGFHRCLKRQISALSSGHCGSSFSCLPVLIHTLDQLASACFALPQHLAKHITANSTFNYPTSGENKPQGPRARGRLWWLATQHAAGLDMPLEDPELHVFLRSFHERADILLRSVQIPNFEDKFSTEDKYTFNVDKTHLSNPSGRTCYSHSSYNQALRLFASDLVFFSPLDSTGEVKSSEDQYKMPRWMFVEAIEPNREAVRLALIACYLIAITL
ncbi:unnamed protein product [Phytomonas sp. Hart1]|nr:unnamed protein product [Phytomonas sp. Hart1]|eukprot:CCW68410.1 unnamed protein product [Phytomonas sp. isolate Hart1]